MKHTYFFIAILLLLKNPIEAQILGTDYFEIASDNASNYATWNNGDNQGSGFDVWALSSAGGGHYVGVSGAGNPSLAVYSDGAGNYASAIRNFNSALKQGDRFRIDLGHTVTINGEIFLQLLDNGSPVITLKFVGGTSDWQLNDGGSDFGSGQPYSANTAITFTFTYNEDGTYSYTFGTGSGSNYVATNSITNINGIQFQSTDQGSGENFGMNNLLIESKYTIAGNSTVTSSGDITVPFLDVQSGSTLNIPSSSNITITGALNNSGAINMTSSSSDYPSLIANTAAGEITYNRFVNAIGITGTEGGNDLISIPVMPSAGLNFEELTLQGSPANNTKIVMNPAETLFAFGPYDNTSYLTYINYQTYNGNNPPLPTDPPSLVKGKGYRAATNSGETLTFTGAVETGNVNIGISTPIGGSQWNLIGNPYTSYIDASSFLNPVNTDVMDISAQAIYGYNSNAYSGSAPTTGNYTIINLATLSIPGETFNIAPGQGFFVASNTTGGDIEYFPSMRTISGDDDYISGRDSEQSYYIKLDLIGSSTYSTSIFFNPNASLGLDPGYDAAVFGENGNLFPIYSHLIEDNLGRAMAIQSLGVNNLTDVSIPLGVNASQGEAITFSINSSTLPSTTEVYLEDNVTNTFTLLNTSDYTITPNANLNGTGRFYLRATDGALSTPQNDLDNLSIYTNQSNKTVVVAGQLLVVTIANIYDIQGRVVNTSSLQTTNRSQTIDVSNLSTGVYVVQLVNGTQNKTQKVIIK